MMYEVLNRGDIEMCALAASMSYGKDLTGMTNEEKEAYVHKIWDKHTNVSEHYISTIHFTNIPRFASLLLAFQRDGFTMTEMSQRRREVNWHSWDGEMYRDLLASGVKFEDARKVLRCGVPSECIVTLNRESARNIARLFSNYAKIPFFRTELEELGLPKILAEEFEFDVDNEAARNSPRFTGFSWDMTEPTSCQHRIFVRNKLYVSGTLPLYSFHQFLRHRKIKLLDWGITYKKQVCSISDVPNDATVEFSCSSLNWPEFVATREGHATQEPLRSFALDLKAELK